MTAGGKPIKAVERAPLFDGKKLEDLSDHEFIEAIEQNNRLADALSATPCDDSELDDCMRKAEALAAEGARRGLKVKEEAAGKAARERESLITALLRLLQLREVAKTSSPTEYSEMSAEALSLMRPMVQVLISWALTSRSVPAGGDELRYYRHRLASDLMLLGFPQVGGALRDLNYGHKRPLTTPSRKTMRGGGPDDWISRIKLLEHVHFHRGLLGSEKAAFAEFSDVTNIKVDTLQQWEKTIHMELREASIARLNAQHRAGDWVRNAYLPTRRAELLRFAAVHLQDPDIADLASRLRGDYAKAKKPARKKKVV